jgi:hypothetical protein
MSAHSRVNVSVEKSGDQWEVRLDGYYKDWNPFQVTGTNAELNTAIAEAVEKLLGAVDLYR